MSYLGPDLRDDDFDVAAGVVGRPIPDTRDPLTARFWEAANREQLTLRRCSDCGTVSHPPVFGVCIECQSDEFVFVPVSGAGRVYSYAVIHDQRIAAFDQYVPYVVASIELDEVPGIFFQTNLPGASLNDIRFDARVDVFFEEIAPDVRIPQWRLVQEGLR